MGPRTDAKVAKYNFLFFTLLKWEKGTEEVIKKKKSNSQVMTFTHNQLCSGKVDGQMLIKFNTDGAYLGASIQYM